MNKYVFEYDTPLQAGFHHYLSILDIKDSNWIDKMCEGSRILKEMLGIPPKEYTFEELNQLYSQT